MRPDAILRVRFLTASEGGRSAAVDGDFYRCPLFVEGEGFDCRIMLGGKRLELGAVHEVPIKFLYRDDALRRLSVGKKVQLWEGRVITDGEVMAVIDAT